MLLPVRGGWGGCPEEACAGVGGLCSQELLPPRYVQGYGGGVGGWCSVLRSHSHQVCAGVQRWGTLFSRVVATRYVQGCGGGVNG